MTTRIIIALALSLAVIAASEEVPSNEMTAARSEDVPKGVVVMASIQDVLLQPSSSPIVGNSVAVGNNVLISNSNANVDKAETADNKLAQAVEDRLVLSEASADGANLVSELLTMFAGSDELLKEAIRPRIRALILLRSDPIRLHSTIVAIIAIVRPSPLPTQTVPSAHTTSTSPNEVFFGYRVLFRYQLVNTYRFGWRYPLNYWNAFGTLLYPGGCGFGQVFGSFFYC